MFYFNLKNNKKVMFIKLFITLIFIYLSFNANLLALDPSYNLNQYISKNWQIEDGLPQISVTTIQQSKDGYLWFGTEEGLVRFNGYEFKVYNKYTDKILSNSYITALNSFDNIMLIAIFGKGLIKMEGGKINELSISNFEKLSSISLIKRDKEGGVWIGTFGKGLWYWHNNVLKEIELEGLKEEINIRCIIEDRDSEVWIGTEGKGIFIYKEGTAKPFYLNNRLPDLNIFALLEDDEGFYWIGTSRGLVKFSKNNYFEVFNEKNGLKNSNIRTLFQDKDSVIWIGTTGGGIQRFFKNNFIKEIQPSALSKETILSIFEDLEGNIWIGTMGSGLYQFSNSLVKNLGKEEGFEKPLIFSIFQDKKGNVWAGTSDGLFKLEKGKDKFNKIKGPPDNIILGLMEDKKGGIYVGTYRGGIGYYFNNKWVYYNAKNGLPSNKVFTIIEDCKGNIWAGTEMGIAHWNNKKWLVIDDKDGLPGKKINVLFQDKDKKIWVGTNYGIGVIYENSNGFNIKNFLTKKDITSFYMDLEGNLWITTQGDGIFLYKNKKFYSLRENFKFPVESFYTILEDNEGFLWLSSAKGLIRVSKKELEDYFLNNSNNLKYFHFGKEDGMRSEECVGVSKPAGIKDNEENLWFPTIKGIALLNPKSIPKIPYKFPIYIEGIKFDNKFVKPINGLSFAPSKGNIEIHFSGLFFSSPNILEYKYRLINFESDWVYANKRRVAYYTNLPPKKYIFEVSARIKNYDYNETTQIYFSIKPHFYQTWIFYIIIGFLLASIVYGIFRLRLNLLKAKTAVLEERARISREIHDTLAQSFAAIVIQSEALKSTEFKDKNKILSRVDKIQELARSGLQEARRSIKSLSSPVLQERNLSEAIAYICRNMIGEESIKLNIKIEGKQRKLKQKTEVNLLRITQEAISNAIKHSRANQIDLTLIFSEKDVVLIIYDNGIGFEVESSNFMRGDGLKNMKERAKEINGEIEILSKLGYGTKIIVKTKK